MRNISLDLEHEPSNLAVGLGHINIETLLDVIRPSRFWWSDAFSRRQ